MNRLKAILAGSALMLFGATAANAAFYQIQLGGIDLHYDQASGLICDGTAAGCSDSTDPLDIMTFKKDGVVQGYVFPADDIRLFLNLFVAAGTDPTVNQTAAFVINGFETFDALIGVSGGIATDPYSGSATFSDTGVNLAGSGFSTIVGQLLPFGFVATDPINFSFSSGSPGAVSSCTGVAGSLKCYFSGTGEMSWQTTDVPEPGSMILLGAGLLGLGVAARRRRAV